MMFKTPSFWYQSRSRMDRFLPKLLSPLGKLYGAVSRHRFDMHYPVPMAKPVVCVGNVVAGGAGKTPVVMSLVAQLQEKGMNPHILTRGYGGREEGPLQVSPGRDIAEDVGDEALLLVHAAPTWVSKSRALGAQAAMDTGASIIVMDDGYQNPEFFKDVSLLVIDGAVGFGNGCVMPAGPLREAADFALSRAHAVIILGEDKRGLRAQIAALRDIPVFGAELKPAAGNPEVAGRQVYAFAGIGRPEKFRATLEAAGAQVEGWGDYPDHFMYEEQDLRDLLQSAEARGLPVLTTAKDHVRLPEALKARIQPFHVDLVWEEGADVAQFVLDTLAARRLM